MKRSLDSFRKVKSTCRKAEEITFADVIIHTNCVLLFEVKKRGPFIYNVSAKCPLLRYTTYFQN